MQTKDLANKPGIKPEIDLSGATEDEHRIIRRFGRVFAIGYFRWEEFRQFNYRFFFCKPTTDFNLKFNLESNILALFNDANIFEERTLDFVDHLMNRFFNRLDKVCVVIISKDIDICKKIEAVNTRQRTSRVVVPFSYQELLDSHADNSFIENRFKRFFYSRDLFDIDSPLTTDSFFFGRTHLVQQFYDKYSNSENSALFGLRKIGKTSLLYAVRRLCDQKDIPVIYIDCQSPSFHKRRWFEVLEYIVEIGSASLQNIGTFRLLSQHYEEKDAAKFFEKDMNTLKQVRGQQRILLIFDEIENITFELSPTPHWRSGEDSLLFWQTIRSIFQSDRSLLSFIIAGVNPTVLEQSSIGKSDNPIFNIATPSYLELFCLETLREMINKIGGYMGLIFEEDVSFLLLEDFGGHPFLTRIACSNINKLLGVERPKRVTKYWYRENREKFAQHVMAYVEQLLSVLRNFYESEYNMLQLLAGGDKKRFEEILFQSPGAAKHLEGYGLVNTKNNEYYFKLGIVEEYLNQRACVKKVYSTKEEKLAEVSKRRNALEEKLKKLAKLVLHMNYGPDARSRILNAIPTERRSKIEHLTVDEILTDHYLFLDLMQLFVKEFKYFENIFEKQSNKFYKALEHINKFRIDAHAKDIDEDDLQMLILEFNWLDKCLIKVNIS